MSIELTGEEIHKMPILKLKEFYEKNNSKSFKESDDVLGFGEGESERERIYYKGFEDTIKAQQNGRNK